MWNEEDADEIDGFFTAILPFSPLNEDTGEPDGNMNIIEIDEQVADESNLRPLEEPMHDVRLAERLFGPEPDYFSFTTNTRELRDELHNLRMNDINMRGFIDLFGLIHRQEKHNTVLKRKFCWRTYWLSTIMGMFHTGMTIFTETTWGVAWNAMAGSAWLLVAGWCLGQHYLAWKEIEEGGPYDEYYNRYIERRRNIVE